MNLKALLEKRAELLAKIEMENKSETRSVEKIDELLNELDTVKADIEREERLLQVSSFATVSKEEKGRDYNEEIRSAIDLGKELDITGFEVETDVEERTIGIGNQGGQITKSVGNIKKTSFANAILKKASETSDLYRYVRKENLGTALHQIPVQKTKVGTFLNVPELNDYAQKDIEFDTVQLSAHKFGNISVISEEALADTGYNLMAELIEQYGEGAGETLDKLLVKGDNVGVQGLESFINSGNGNPESGAIKQSVARGDLDTVGLDHVMAMYNGLPNKYRKNATWVIGTELAARLTATVDGVGRPLLYQDFSQVPFGGKPTPMLFGRPVVISDHVNAITGATQHKPIAFFGDLNKALILGMRQSFTIKSSTEYAWLKDGVAIKGTMRLDAKRALGEAMVVLAVTA